MKSVAICNLTLEFAWILPSISLFASPYLIVCSRQDQSFFVNKVIKLQKDQHISLANILKAILGYGMKF